MTINHLKPHPKNRNTHPSEQIKRLASVLNYQGWRYPIKVSKLSGYVTSGHGRIEAAKTNGWNTVPVNYQEYEDETQEYADVVADNAIASWSELDLKGINIDVVELGPDFDIDLLGLRNFLLEPAEKFNPDDHWKDMPEFIQNDETAFRSIRIHFANQDSINRFSKLLKQEITEKTKWLWYPKLEKEIKKDKSYESIES